MLSFGQCLRGWGLHGLTSILLVWGIFSSDFDPDVYTRGRGRDEEEREVGEMEQREEGGNWNTRKVRDKIQQIIGIK